MLIRETKEDLNKLRDIPGSWTERFNIVNTSILLKLIYSCSIISIKISLSFIVKKISKLFIKSIWKYKGPKHFWEDGNKVGWLTFLTSKFIVKLQSSRQYCIHIKTILYSLQDVHTGQWNPNRVFRNKTTYIWSVDFQQCMAKPLQYCKLISLQLK